MEEVLDSLTEKSGECIRVAELAEIGKLTTPHAAMNVVPGDKSFSWHLSVRLFHRLLGVFIEEFEHIWHRAGDDAAMVEAWHFLPLDVKACGY